MTLFLHWKISQSKVDSLNNNNLLLFHNYFYFADVVCYIYTSGTTGLPKAVPITNQRLPQCSVLLHTLMLLQIFIVAYIVHKKNYA